MLLGKVVFIAGMIMQIIIRYPYRDRAKSGQKERQEQLLLILLSIGELILPLIYIFTDWLAFADYSVPLWVIGIGIVVMIIGLWLFWRSHSDLGRNWSSTLEIHDDHTLITQGVYRHVRHPMYSASWLMMAAQVLLLSNWIAGFGGLVAFAFMYFLRVQKEEAMMLKQFGKQYQAYMEQTGRVIPKTS
jgi:protein-S-isoprenylcysteine O-methyltransferase Ste14